MAIDNSIIFGGVNSADFGIYISGEGVFNAPERDVEMIEIPGRNGALALDKGRFKNISVTYPAFNYEPNDYDTFAERLADFRNAICAQRGYQRLEDTFHPDEYRMAAYVDGLEIKPIKYNTASEFDITFDCKPQRWLKSGETAITVDSGDVISNPTLFESSPMLEVEGYGGIEINGEAMSVNNEELGTITIASASSGSGTSTALNVQNLNTGDRISANSALKIRVNLSYSGYSMTVKKSSVSSGMGASISKNTNKRSLVEFSMGLTAIGSWYYGTSRTASGTVTLLYELQSESGGSTTSTTKTYTISMTYNGDATITVALSGSYPNNVTRTSTLYEKPMYKGDSSKSTLPSPFYIDLEIGEAYGEVGGEVLSLNDLATLPSDLPKFSTGANTITFDNTITELKVRPRWWRV